MTNNGSCVMVALKRLVKMPDDKVYANISQKTFYVYYASRRNARIDDCNNYER